MDKQLSSTERYGAWVKDRYPNPAIGHPLNSFIAYDSMQGKTLDVAHRFLLYTESGYTVILNGQTGIGKSVLLEYASAQTGKPMFRVPPVKELRYSEVVGSLMETHDKSIIFTPGPLLRFLIADKAYLAFDEMANLNSRVATALHDVLQYKGVEVETHEGLVQLTPSPGKHSIVGSGNFSYQKPNFSKATLQRCVFIEMPRLEGKLLEDDLREAQPQKTMAEHKELVDRMYPWKSEGTLHPLKVDYRWMDAINDGQEKQDVLVELGKDIVNACSRYKGFSGISVDLSNAALKRIISLYSPFIGLASFKDIVLENLVNPITVEHPHMQDEKKAFSDQILALVDRHSKKLFDRKSR